MPALFCVKMEHHNSFTPQQTKDGSFTFFSPDFGECFHSVYGAAEEAETIYIKACQLAEKARQTDRLRLLDVCYGLGYNSATALAKIWEVNPACCVELIALEIDAEVPKSALSYGLLNIWSHPIPFLLQQLVQDLRVETSTLKAQLLLGDARTTIQSVYASGFQADAIFFDPFSPPKCPQLWTVEFLSLAAQCLAPTGKLATYSNAAAVRAGLRHAGLAVASIENQGKNSPGTLASWNREDFPPLSPKEEEQLQTRAAVPYRDSTLKATAEEILQRRKEEQLNSPLESSSQWKKRWSS